MAVRSGSVYLRWHPLCPNNIYFGKFAKLALFDNLYINQIYELFKGSELFGKIDLLLHHLPLNYNSNINQLTLKAKTG